MSLTHTGVAYPRVVRLVKMVVFGAIVSSALALASPASAETTIVWTNRGTAGDGFAAVFGAGAPADQARAVVDAAIDHWERVVQAVNRPLTPDDDTIPITVTMNPGSGCGGGAGSNYDAMGWPTGGDINLNGNAANWFIDPTPNDHAEFTGNIDNAFSGDAPNGGAAAGLCDLYTVMALETTHILGITSNGASRFQTGGFNTEIPGSSTCAGPGTLWTFTGPSITALMSSNNGGSGGTDRGVPVHTAEPCDSSGGLSGSSDTGNAVFEGSRRYLASNLDSLILKDTYNFTIAPPETFGTFYATLNSTTGDLLIRGGDDAGTSDDVITVTRSAGVVTASVDIGTDVAGTGPTDEFVSSFPAGQVQSVTVNADDGNDAVTISNDLGIATTVNGGDGNDTLIGGDIIINGGAGNDLITGSVGVDTLSGDGGDDEIYGFESADVLSGGDGNDVIYAADGADEFAGGGGSDQIFAGPGNNSGTDGTGNDLVDLTQNSVSLAYTTGGGNDTVLGSAFNDDLTGGSGTDRLEGGGGNDTLTGAGAGDSLFGDAGSDTFNWSPGDGSDVVEGGAGETDTLRATGDHLTATRGTGSRLSVSGLADAVDGGSIEDVQLVGLGGPDTLSVEDLSASEARSVSIEPSAGASSIDVAGKEIGEALEVAPVGSSTVAVGGLAYDLRIVGADASDRLALRGNGGNDSLTASGLAGQDTLAVVPTAADAATLTGVGLLSIDATTIEQIAIEGRGGDDTLRVTSPLGPQTITLTPGAAADSGDVVVAGLVPVRYASLGLPGKVAFVDAGALRADRLVYRGTAAADGYTVAAGGITTLNEQSLVVAGGVNDLVLDAGVGDDRFSVAAGQPFATTALQGGDSVLGDSATLTGAGGPVAVDLEALSVSGYGGVVSLSSVESLATGQTADAGTDLTVTGRSGPDTIDYRPSSSYAGLVTAAGVNTALAFDGVGGTFTIDPLGDADDVRVAATLQDDTVRILAGPVTTVNVNDRKGVSIPQATTERISALGDEGADLFDVTTFDTVAARLYVFGDTPSSKRFSENLVVRNGSTSHVQYRDVKSHVKEVGSVLAEYRSTSMTTRIDYDGVENLKFYR